MMVIGAALNILAVIVGAFLLPTLFHIHLSQEQMAALATISTAVTSIIAGLLVRPIHLGVINTAVSTALVATAAFGLHITPANIAEVTGVITAILSYLMREKVTAIGNLV
jgi:hypothetical protein